MRATTTPALHTRLRGIAAGSAAAALALALMPGDAVAQTADPIDVTVKIADQPAVEVASVPKIWPTTLLEAHGIPVDGNDLVRVRRDGRKVSGERKRLRHGDVVRLIAVEKKRVVKHKKVRAGVVEVPTTKLKPGVRKVVRKGKPGLRKVVAKRTFHDGKPVKYKVVKRKMVEKSRAKRVLVGRKPYSVPGADGLNWAALARCESGGNPRAVNPAGYYGLYQFDIGTWRSVGGSGLPTGASAGEQTYRAKLLYKQRGRSPWPTCGRLL